MNDDDVQSMIELKWVQQDLAPKRCASGKDYEDCEILFEAGKFNRTDAASWMGDDYIYRVK